MTYDAIEKSEYSSRPVELYEFWQQNSYWWYTSADEDNVFGLHNYTAVPISRGSFKAANESVKSDLDLEIDPSISLLSQYINQVPYDPVYLKITRYYPANGSNRVLWRGRITDVGFKGLSYTDVTCESICSAMRRNTLRRCWQKSCPHALYSQGYGECMVDKEGFRLDGSVTLVSGSTMTVSTTTMDDNYLQGGYLVITTQSDRVIRRYIRSQVGFNLVLDALILDDVTGLDVAMYPGCGHSMSICISKFHNIINYGGHPWLPEKNPMNGSLVF